MSIFYPSCLASEVHLYVKNNVTRSFVPANGGLVIRSKDLKHNAHIPHLLGKGIFPKVVPMLAVKVKGFFDGERNLDSILVRAFANS